MPCRYSLHCILCIVASSLYHWCIIFYALHPMHKFIIFELYSKYCFLCMCSMHWFLCMCSMHCILCNILSPTNRTEKPGQNPNSGHFAKMVRIRSEFQALARKSWKYHKIWLIDPNFIWKTSFCRMQMIFLLTDKYLSNSVIHEWCEWRPNFCTGDLKKAQIWD